MLLQNFALSCLATSPSRLPAFHTLWLFLHCLCFSLPSNRSRKSDHHHESGLQNQNSKSPSINAIFSSEFPDPFSFYFWKDTKINFLSNLPSSKISHSDWHFPHKDHDSMPQTKCRVPTSHLGKAMLFLQELVSLMKPAYGPFNRKLKRLQNTI